MRKLRTLTAQTVRIARRNLRTIYDNMNGTSVAVAFERREAAGGLRRPHPLHSSPPPSS
jgi:hypothetical protein